MITPTTITDRRPAVLASGLTLGPVTIAATDLERSVAFYESVIGLHVGRRTDASVTLGVGDGDVATLTYEPGARPAARDAGLYHVALLYRTREELARSLRRIAEGGADRRR